MIGPQLSRRSFHRLVAGNLLAVGLANFMHGTATADDQGVESLDRWFQDYRKLGEQLARGVIRQDAWQDGMARLYQAVSIPALMNGSITNGSSTRSPAATWAIAAKCSTRS